MNSSIPIIAVGLMLLISMAAAEGIGNHISVNIHKEAEGNCATGETLIVQDVDVITNVDGDNNFVEQNVDLFLDANNLVGTEDRPASITQQALVVGNVSGNSNKLNQNLLMNACNNDLDKSNLSQKATQAAEIQGSYNDVSQSMYVDSSGNDATLSDIKQSSTIKTSILGNRNNVDQSADELVEDDCLTGSKIWQSIEIPATIVGSGHTLNQYANTTSINNSLTAGAVEGQKISEVAKPLGIRNSAKHNIVLTQANSSIIGRTFVQESSVISKL